VGEGRRLGVVGGRGGVAEGIDGLDEVAAGVVLEGGDAALRVDLGTRPGK
jgi:hypothetical protein